MNSSFIVAGTHSGAGKTTVFLGLMRLRRFLTFCGLVAFLVSKIAAEGPFKKLRIVSLMPSNTEVVFDLGAGDSLVGITSFCNYPSQTEKIDKVGDFIHPNIEKILSLKPDVVLAGRWPSSKVVLRLRELGLNVVEIKLPATLEEIYETIFYVAKEIGREKEAGKVVADLRKRVDQITAKARERKYKPRIFIHIDPPNWTVSKLSFISDALERCGAVNVFRDLPAAGAQVSLESIIEKDPEVFLLSQTSKKELLRQTAWGRITAVKKGYIIDDIEKDWINRPTPRIVLGMEKLSESLSRMKFE